MKIAVIGANGQLGSDVVAALRRRSYEIVELNHDAIAVEDAASVAGALGRSRPDVVVNTSAMHNVPECEKDPARSFAINGIGPRNLAAEFAPKVRINAIAVGAVLTAALAPFLNEEAKARMEALTPLGRLGEVEDIALMALYLASPASSWVTGKIFEVDGGTEAPAFTVPTPPL